MNRILKRILICVISFFTLILALAGILVLQGTCFSSKEIKDNNVWMGYIRDDVYLNDIVIPGSHDAGANDVNYMLRTQYYSIKDQLRLGIRYFDLRVRKESDNYYLYHSFANGEVFNNALNDIVEYIIANPTEVLLLDFQHFDNGAKDDVYDIVNERLINENLALKNDKNVEDLVYISNIKLNETRGKCIIFFGEGDKYTNDDYIFARNNDSSSLSGMSLNSTYISKYNKSSSKKYINEGIVEYITQIRNKIDLENNKGIFVLQGQLTDGLFVFGPYSKERSHNKNMTNYIEALRDSDDLNIINVIMRDFLNEDKTKQIISLNYNKNNVKDNEIDIFKNIYINE